MKRNFAASLILVLFVFNAQAQNGSADSQKKANLVKFNLAGLVLNNYAFQYERSLKKKMSLAVSVNYRPYGKLPIRKLVQDYMGNDNAESYQIVDKFKVSMISFAPELRFYLGRGYGHGFYVAPFYRFSSFKSEDLKIFYQDKNDVTKSREVAFKGNLVSNTLGIMFGSQWLIGKRFCIDWTIAGPNVGVSSGSFEAVTNFVITSSDQAEIERQINNLDIPLTKVTYDYPAPNIARLKFNGPWAGFRVGLSVGVQL